MTFAKYIPEHNNPQQQHLPQSEFKEIYEQKNTVKIVPKLENQFQTLVEKTSALIFVIQAAKICYANPIAELTTGYSRSQLLTNQDFYHQLNPKGHNLEDSKSYHNNELKIQLNSDRECWLNCYWETIEWECQSAIMITAIDVTKYKQLAIESNQALAAEKELCRSKTRFVSMVSHEFRTPLNIISFSTSLLKRHLNQWNETKQLKYLNRLQTAVGQLSSLMDEVLIIGKVEAGKLKFDPQSLNLDSFCHNLLTEINLSQPNCAKINFVNLSERDLILVDQNLLKLVLLNLLGNAIKYSPADSTIKFTVSCNDEQIIFKIIDRGIGIPEQDRAKIFEPFHRSNNVGDLPGHGLGLAIAKKIVELQSGQIFLAKEVDVGSTFVVKIPLKTP
jgi:signal transduction histidine kinase